MPERDWDWSSETHIRNLESRRQLGLGWHTGAHRRQATPEHLAHARVAAAHVHRRDECAACQQNILSERRNARDDESFLSGLMNRLVSAAILVDSALAHARAVSWSTWASAAVCQEASACVNQQDGVKHGHLDARSPVDGARLAQGVCVVGSPGRVAPHDVAAFRQHSDEGPPAAAWRRASRAGRYWVWSSTRIESQAEEPSAVLITPRSQCATAARPARHGSGVPTLSHAGRFR